MLVRGRAARAAWSRGFSRFLHVAANVGAPWRSLVQRPSVCPSRPPTSPHRRSSALAWAPSVAHTGESWVGRCSPGSAPAGCCSRVAAWAAWAMTHTIHAKDVEAEVPSEEELDLRDDTKPADLSQTSSTRRLATLPWQSAPGGEAIPARFQSVDEEVSPGDERKEVWVWTSAGAAPRRPVELCRMASGPAVRACASSWSWLAAVTSRQAQVGRARPKSWARPAVT